MSSRRRSRVRGFFGGVADAAFYFFTLQWLDDVL